MTQDISDAKDRRLVLVEIPIETQEEDRPGNFLLLGVTDREMITITIPGAKAISVRATILNSAIEVVEAARRGALFIAQ